MRSSMTPFWPHPHFSQHLPHWLQSWSGVRKTPWDSRCRELLVVFYAILQFILPTAFTILKFLPLIVRTLVIVIMVYYICFAMYLKSKGEGGTIVFYRRLNCTFYIRFRGIALHD
jgi:hypothetical protein